MTEANIWFDSHSHFATDAEEVLARAQAAGLRGVLAVGGGRELNNAAIQAARLKPDFAQLALGWDRSDAGTRPAESLAARLRDEINTLKSEGIPTAAIGETGLDYYYDDEKAADQRELFARQTALAAELDLPLVIHSREADADTLAIIKDAGCKKRAAAGTLGVLHCFTGGRQFAEHLLEAGLMISFSGILTFRNAAPLREVAGTIPAERLLVETDSPYLAPVPLRGRRNEPAYLPHVGGCLAEQRGVDPREIAELTLANARRLLTPANADA